MLFRGDEFFQCLEPSRNGCLTQRRKDAEQGQGFPRVGNGVEFREREVRYVSRGDY